MSLEPMRHADLGTKETWPAFWYLVGAKKILTAPERTTMVENPLAASSAAVVWRTRADSSELMRLNWRLEQMPQ